jgi:alkaline phosphatase
MEGVMKKIYQFGLSLLVSSLLVCTSTALAGNDKKFAGENTNVKNVIFMVPDGMGISNVTAARIFQNGPNGARLTMETLNTIGYQSTHSANSTVTDSAAAASAWAVGDKFFNGEISCHADIDPSCDDLTEAPLTILEIAESLGKVTGLVATSQVSHATPAAFGAHTLSRNCGAEITRQYIEETDVDVILGGGIYKTNPECDVYTTSYDWATSDADKGRPEITASALANGYTVVETKAALEAAVIDGTNKILGMFDPTNSGKTVEYFRVGGPDYPSDEPTLAEMTSAALNILEDNNKGFFLMVEGSQIDWEDHANNVDGQIAEILGFNAAVEEVLNWVNAEESRKNHTLVVIAPDHDTAGFAITGPYGTISQQGDTVLDGWVSGDHTATDVVIWSEGPGCQYLGKALDNTDLFHIIKDIMK